MDLPELDWKTHLSLNAEVRSAEVARQGTWEAMLLFEFAKHDPFSTTSC